MGKEIWKSIVFNGENECTNERERETRLLLPAKCGLCGIGQKEREREMEKEAKRD